MSFTKRRDSSQQSIMTIIMPLMLVLFISTLDQTIVATALHGIGLALGGAENAPWIATSYLLTSAVTTLIFGKLGDMYGRKTIFQIAVLIFVIGSALCALAPSMFWLIVFRAFQGIGGGGLNTLVMAIVGDLVPARERGRYQAILGIVPAIAIIVGPLLGGFIVDTWSWQWIFLINVPLGIIALLMIAKKLHLQEHINKHRIDIAGSLLAMVFTTAFLLIAAYGGHIYQWSSWQVLGLLVVALFSLGTYIWVEHHVAEPITPLHLFKNSIFTLSAILFFLATGILFIEMLFVPMFLQSVFKVSAFVAGAFLIPLLLGLIVASVISGNAIAKTGRYKIYPIIGAILSGATLFSMTAVNMTTPLWIIILILTVSGIGIGFFIQVSVLAGQNAVEHRYLGTATGTLNFFKTMGGAVSSAVFGAIFIASLLDVSPSQIQMTHAYHSVFLWAVPLMVIALILAFFLKEKQLSEEMIEIAEGKLEAPEY